MYSLGERVRGLCTVWKNVFVDCVQFGRICSWIVYSLEECVRGLSVWKNMFVDCVQFGRICSWIVYSLEEYVR